MKWQQSNRWLVCIGPYGYMTAFRADSYTQRASRYRDFVPFCQVRNATREQINYAMIWAIKNLGV